MPYIKPNDRPALDLPIEMLILAQSQEGHHPGSLNYILTRLVNAFVEAHGGNYAAHSAAHGVLADVQMEHYRRRTAPYEDTKIEENGDVE